jgi:hypothetical protein
MDGTMKLYRAAAYPTGDGRFRAVVLVSDENDPTFVREREVPGWECTTRDNAFRAAADYAEVLREYDVSVISPRRKLDFKGPQR